ncbi:MAG: galactokinase, partial [Actinomycetota bacterium]|nr:galactokinase [Actinomycetota bacterium]
MRRPFDNTAAGAATHVMSTVPPQVEELLRTRVDIAVRAPGRANLIGEHTDYNEGFVLPIAIEPACFVVGTTDDVIRLASTELETSVTIDVLSGKGETEAWGRYVAAVVKALNDNDVPLRGIDGTVTSTVPIGAGLSSSAALEVALVRALAVQEMEPVDVAQICRRAENNYVGVRSGIMDPLVSAAARLNHACLIDCRSNTIEYIRVPDGIRFVIVDSGIERSLAASGYNERRSECEAAAEELGVTSLRDVSAMDLPEARKRLDEVAYRRVRHVVSENERVHA